MSNWKKTMTAVGLTCVIAVTGVTATACKKDPGGDTPPGPVETQYTVKFDAQGGSAVADKMVTGGTTVTKPADPSRSGYIFGGWYKDAACTDGQVWNFATDKVSGAITLYAKWTAEAPVAGEIDWVEGTMPVIYSDTALYNKNRATEDVLTTALSGVVYGTEDGERIATIITDVGGLARDEATGLIAVKEYSITYTAQDSTGATHDKVVKLTVKDAEKTNYYVEFKNARGGKGMEDVVGTRIRVAEDLYFESTADGELPDALKNPHAEGKIADLDDPFVLKNVSAEAMSVNIQDGVATYLVFDAAGKVVWGFEGVMAYVVDESNPFPARVNTKPTSFSVPAGGYALVVGYTQTGNWYAASEDGKFVAADNYWGDKDVSNMWDIDGRQMTYMDGMYRYGNMVRLTRDGSTLTDAYANQLPYVMKGTDTLKIFVGTELTASLFTADITVWDDNGETFGPDVQVAKPVVTVDYSAVKADTVGKYTATYTIQDSTDSAMTTTFTREIEVTQPEKYLQFGTKVIEYADVKVNATNDDVAFRLNTKEMQNTTLLVYNNEFAGVKPSEAAVSNKRPFNFASFVVYGSDGTLKAWINAATQKLYYQGADGIAEIAVTGGKDMFKYFKLNADDTNVAEGAYELTDGDILYTAYHSGDSNNLRGFFTDLTKAIQDKTGDTVADKGVELTVSPRSFASYGDRMQAIGSVKLNATNDDIAFRINSNELKNTTLLIYDNKFAGEKPSNAPASNKRPFNFASFVVYDSDGTLKAWINASTQKLCYQGADGIVEIAVTGGTDMFRYFKLNADDANVVEGAYELADGDTLYTAYHTGDKNNVRDFLTALTKDIQDKAGDTVADKGIALRVVEY